MKRFTKLLRSGTRNVALASLAGILAACSASSTSLSSQEKYHPSIQDDTVDQVPFSGQLYENIPISTELTFIYPEQGEAISPESITEGHLEGRSWVTLELPYVRPKLTYSGSGEIENCGAFLVPLNINKNMERLFSYFDFGYVRNLTLINHRILSEIYLISNSNGNKDVLFSFPLRPPVGEYKLEAFLETTTGTIHRAEVEFRVDR